MPEGGSAPTTKTTILDGGGRPPAMQSIFHILLPCLSQSGGGTEGGGLAPRPEFYSVQAWATTGYSETNFNLDAIALS